MSLDVHHLLNSLHNIKLLNVFSELFIFDLGKVDEIVHEESHEVGWRLLDCLPLAQFL
jgi:hypothetical protein